MGTGWRRSRGRMGCGRLKAGVSTLGQADWGALNAGRAVKGLEMESGWRWDRRVRPSPESGRTLGMVTPRALLAATAQTHPLNLMAKATQLYELSAAGQKSTVGLAGLKSRCRLGAPPSRGSGESLLSCRFQLLEAPASWHLPLSAKLQ